MKFTLQQQYLYSRPRPLPATRPQQTEEQNHLYAWIRIELESVLGAWLRGEGEME